MSYHEVTYSEEEDSDSHLVRMTALIPPPARCESECWSGCNCRCLMIHFNFNTLLLFGILGACIGLYFCLPLKGIKESILEIHYIADQVENNFVPAFNKWKPMITKILTVVENGLLLSEEDMQKITEILEFTVANLGPIEEFLRFFPEMKRFVTDTETCVGNCQLCT